MANNFHKLVVYLEKHYKSFDDSRLFMKEKYTELYLLTDLVPAVNLEMKRIYTILKVSTFIELRIVEEIDAVIKELWIKYEDPIVWQAGVLEGRIKEKGYKVISWQALVLLSLATIYLYFLQIFYTVVIVGIVGFIALLAIQKKLMLFYVKLSNIPFNILKFKSIETGFYVTIPDFSYHQEDLDVLTALADFTEEEYIEFMKSPYFVNCIKNLESTSVVIENMKKFKERKTDEQQ
jgi:hypothetical protein